MAMLNNQRVPILWSFEKVDDSAVDAMLLTQHVQKSTALTEIHRFERSHPMIPSGKHTKDCGKSPLFMGKPSINGSFSMAMLNNQRVYPMKDSHEN